MDWEDAKLYVLYIMFLKINGPKKALKRISSKLWIYQIKYLIMYLYIITIFFIHFFYHRVQTLVVSTLSIIFFIYILV